MRPSVAVLGVGSMGGALLRGLLAAGWTPGELAAAVRTEESARRVGDQLGIPVATDAVETAAGREVVVLGVKPADVPALLDAIRDTVTADQVVLSLAAGVSLSAIESRLPGVPAVRSMPNTPALVGWGMTAVAPGTHAGALHVGRVRAVLEAVGRVEEVAESQLDAVTAVSGSGPAYVFLLAEALEEAALAAGLPDPLARVLVEQTVAGAGHLLAQSHDGARILRERVTSPGGTTAAALDVFESGEIRSLVRRAVAAAAERSRQLGDSTAS